MKAKQTQSYDIPLHDIKPIANVEEPSLYYFLGAVGFGLLVLGVMIYFIYLWMKRRKAFNIRKYHFELLNKLDLKDTKQSAYSITTYGATFANDSDRHKEMYANLIQRLDSYKYKKAVDEFDSEILGYIEVYKGMVDV